MNGIEQWMKKELDELKECGNYRYFIELNKSAAHFPRFTYTDVNGEKQMAINWCSNDYLGLSTEERVISKLTFSMHSCGSGSGGTRNISGTTKYHVSLEKELAGWYGTEHALIFNSAYLANLTALQTLGRKIAGLIFISDADNHASLIEGMRASDAKKIIFRNNDTVHLDNILRSLPADTPKCIVFESVYSMSGQVAPIEKIMKLSKQYGTLTYIDEVHAVGLYGSAGAGISSLLPAHLKPDIINGTFAKALGLIGGFIASSITIVDFIRSFGSGFIFTSSLPPAICAAAIEAIQLVKNEPDRMDGFHKNVEILRIELDAAGIPYNPNQSHITIIPIGNANRCKQLSDNLLRHHGIYVQPINYPTVAKGSECLRLIVTVKHTYRHIRHLALCLQKELNENYSIDKSHSRELIEIIKSNG